MSDDAIRKALEHHPIPDGDARLTATIASVRQAVESRTEQKRRWRPSPLAQVAVGLVALTLVAVSPVGAAVGGWVEDVFTDPDAVTPQEAIDRGQGIAAGTLSDGQRYRVSYYAAADEPNCLTFSWNVDGRQVSAEPASFLCDYSLADAGSVSTGNPVVRPGNHAADDAGVAAWGLAGADVAAVRIEFDGSQRVIDADLFSLPESDQGSGVRSVYVADVPPGLGFIDRGTLGTATAYNADGAAVGTAPVGWLERHGALSSCGAVALSANPACTTDRGE